LPIAHCLFTQKWRKNSKIHVVSLFAFTFACPLREIKFNRLGVFAYNIFLWLFKIGISIAALFNPKARKWVNGRKKIFQRLESALADRPKLVWMHCASLGEFEQGRPLLEELKRQYPGYKFLLTFFSPSGYEVRKDYKGADWVFYLPMDGPANAKRFLEITNPSLVIFVKYEFWYYYLKKIKYRDMPLLLVSALFWEKMSFFKWYGALQRKMLSRFDHLFVQDTTSKRLIDGIGLAGITSISGDTRFDRVIDIAEKAEPVPIIESFIGDSPAIVAGSTWPEDEEVLMKAMKSVNHPSLKLVVAPHEISEKHIASMLEVFPGAMRFSHFSNTHHSTPNSQFSGFTVLIIDNIGLLSRLYKYATITYIGGGFGKGIHNTLEAAVYGKPVVFGPVFHKFKEAADLTQNGGAFTIASAEECTSAMKKLLEDREGYLQSCAASRNYVYSNRGATQRIIGYIQEKRLLIN
jgi:3-deoxy-D-manno-octulosonic-acid transferase